MNTPQVTAGAGASGGSALLLGGTTSRALLPATFHRYALCPAPWGWHMKRVPPLRSPLLPRLLRGAAFAITVAAGCVGLLALGAWLDA